MAGEEDVHVGIHKIWVEVRLDVLAEPFPC